MNKTAVVSASVTIPAQSSARTLSITAGTPIPSTAPFAPAQKTATKANPSLRVRQYAAAVLKESHLLESVAPCFVADNGRIRKHKEGWILESSEFASCTTGEQVFAIADDIISRVNCILALYCDAASMLSVEHIYWANAEGESLRQIRGSISVNVVSSKGLAELRMMSGKQPLGSAIFQAMILDPAVNEALTLHGESGLSWSQVYDIIEFLGGISGIVKAGHGTNKETRTPTDC